MQPHRFALAIAATAFAGMIVGPLAAQNPTREDAMKGRFKPRGEPTSEAAGETASETIQASGDRARPTEAPTGFDNQTNGFSEQGPPFETIDEDNVEPDPSTKIASSSRKQRRPTTDWVRLTTHRAAANVTRTWSPAAPARSLSTAPEEWLKARSSSRSAARSYTHAQHTRRSLSTSTSRTIFERFASPRTHWAPDLSKQSPTTRCCRFVMRSPRRCAAASCRRPYWRPAMLLGLGASDGRINTRASNRSPLMRT